MAMGAELRCIDYAIHMRKRLLEQEIRSVKLWSGPDSTPCEKGRSELPSKVTGGLFQVFMIPLMLMLFIAVVPIVSLSYAREQWQHKRLLKKELQDLDEPSPSYHYPEEKNIALLWRRYGIHKRFGIEQQMHLIESWIEILYGTDTLKRLDLYARLGQIKRVHFDANTPYYSGDEDAPHFSFMADADSLVREIAKELSAYEGE